LPLQLVLVVLFQAPILQEIMVEILVLEQLQQLVVVVVVLLLSLLSVVMAVLAVE
jgi:hypothetical protein